MHVFEIIQPGTWLKNEIGNDSSAIGMLSSLEHLFYTANLALNLYIEADKRLLEGLKGRIDHDAYQRRKDIEAIIAKEKAVDLYDPAFFEVIQFEAEVREKKERWAHGKLPTSVTTGHPLCFAQLFLYALANFGRVLRAFSNLHGAPAGLQSALELLKERFPDAWEIRHSMQHLDERLQGKGNGGKPLPPPPNRISSVNSMMNGHYTFTLADGRLGKQEISFGAMENLREVYQMGIDSLEWEGSRTHLPRD
jgi:hypothetical protein